MTRWLQGGCARKLLTFKGRRSTARQGFHTRDQCFAIRHSIVHRVKTPDQEVVHAQFEVRRQGIGNLVWSADETGCITEGARRSRYAHPQPLIVHVLDGGMCEHPLAASIHGLLRKFDAGILYIGQRRFGLRSCRSFGLGDDRSKRHAEAQITTRRERDLAKLTHAPRYRLTRLTE